MYTALFLLYGRKSIDEYLAGSHLPEQLTQPPNFRTCRNMHLVLSILHETHSIIDTLSRPTDRFPLV